MSDALRHLADRPVRDLAPPSTHRRTALIVEGGGLRGAFAVGVLRVLHRALGPAHFETVLASSSGVFAATYFVANQPEEMESTWRDRVSGNQLVNHWHWLTPKPVLGLDELIASFQGPVRLDVDALRRAPARVEYVLTDCRTGAAAYVDAKRHDVFELMRASAALPPVYPIPVLVDGVPYYDGGQSDPVPVARAIALGATRVVVVRTRARDYRKPARSPRMARLLLRRAPGARTGWLTLPERYDATLALMEQPPAGVEIVQICPRELRLGRLSRDRGRIIAAIEHGKAMAEEALAATAPIT